MVNNGIKLVTPIFLYVLFRLIGLVPFSVKLSNDNLEKFTFSSLGQVYNGLLIIATLVFCSPAINLFLDASAYRYSARISMIIGLARAIASTIVTLITWLFLIVKQKKAIVIANRMLAVDNMLSTTPLIRYPEGGHLKLGAIVGINIFIWISVVWLDVRLFGALMESLAAMTVVPNMIFNWLLIQYSLVLISIQRKFQAINRGIARLSNDSCSFLDEGRRNADVKKDLYDMITFHGVLYDISCDVADLYSFPIMLIISVSCGAIVATSYYLIVPFIEYTSETPVLLVLDRLAYLAMQVFPIVILTTSVTRVGHEVKSTSIAVHGLLAESHTDRQLQSQVEIFLLKNLHQRLEFTCCGIFSLDCTLLHSIVNMTATYLVIILQFHGKMQ